MAKFRTIGAGDGGWFTDIKKVLGA